MYNTQIDPSFRSPPKASRRYTQDDKKDSIRDKKISSFVNQGNKKASFQGIFSEKVAFLY
ncbi:MAG: hypothetical protein ABIH48_02675 [Candidatus Falkowbacteria bacterium]